VKVMPAVGVNGVLNSVKSGEANIGFLAYDPGRAVEVDFSQPYSIGQNTLLASAIHGGVVAGSTKGEDDEN
jgi:hypothetical protein